MGYNCHIFLKYLVFQTKNLACHTKSISIANLGFRSRNSTFKVKIFEILDFLHIEIEILSISSQILNISKKVGNIGFLRGP